MKGLGTIINVICILLGGTAGCLAGNRLKDNIRETLMTVNGIGVVVIGISGECLSLPRAGRISPKANIISASY